MKEENEVKSLIMTGVWNTLVNLEYVRFEVEGFDDADRAMEAVANEVYSLIWEYLADTD